MSPRPLFSRHTLIIGLAILGLTISLANRVVHVSLDVKPAAHADSDYSKVQHRDKDAFEWVAPVASMCFLWVTEYSPSSEPIEKTSFRLQYDKLYNRPPPFVQPS